MGLIDAMIYPNIPKHAHKEFFEWAEPIEEWELYCTCKLVDGELEECESCKLFFEKKRVQIGKENG